MITVTIGKVLSEDKKPTYPCIKKMSQHNTIIFFTDKKSGFVIASDAQVVNPLGHYSDMWDEERAILIDYPITLRNT